MNVTYQKYGVVLRPMVRDDLELVRMHRNSPEMMRYMTTDHLITQVEMSEWFASLPASSGYWMVEYDGRCVGQVNLKGMKDGVAEPGYIFWDEMFQSGCGVPRAVLALYELAFFELKCNKLEGITAVDNVRAMRLPKAFGFRKVGTTIIKGKSYCRFELTVDEFVGAQKKLSMLF